MALNAPAAPAEQEGLFVVDIDRFQGPLDLLLHLIKQQDIDIFDIPIARITEQFLRAVRGLEALDLEGAGEFLEMAATLVHIKAQMLLPRHDEEEDEDPRAELVRRLLEYEQIREVATRLSTAEADRARRFGKGYVPPRPRPPMEEVPLETTWDDVFEAALAVTVPERHHPSHRISTRTVAMEDKIELILETLARAVRVEFSKLLRPWKEKMHGVMTLLASLELSRREQITLRQARHFAELWLYRRDNGGDGAVGGEAGEEPVEDQAPVETDPGADDGGMEGRS